MIPEPELEEGEAYYCKDDANIDPDVALSYIGDKVQNILGHYQKEFEGEVSAENLGAKFGGYGSFLPVYQRSPVQLQPKSPQRVQNSNLPKYPNHICSKDPAPICVMVTDDPSTQNNDPPSPSGHASRTLKKSFNDSSSRQNADEVSTFPGKVLPSSNSVNPIDKKSLKVRIKVGPDKLTQYNAEIYNLGLTCPSTSEENSHDESDELLLESHDTPDESPANIIQMMTYFPVSGGLLLSPLNEDLLNLESVYQDAPKSSAISVKISTSGVPVETRTKYFDKSKTFKKSSGQFISDLSGTTRKSVGSDNLDHTMPTQRFHDHAKPLDEADRESGEPVPIKKRKGAKDRVKGIVVSADLDVEKSMEHSSGQQLESRCSSIHMVEKHPVRIPQKEVSINHGHGRKIECGTRAPVDDFSGNCEGEGVKVAMDSSHLRLYLSGTSSKHNGFGKAHAVSTQTSEGGNKPKGSPKSGKLASKAASLRSSGCAAPENEYNEKKDVSNIRLSQTDVVHSSSKHMDKPNHLLERSIVDKPKNYTLGAAKTKSAHADKFERRLKKDNVNNVIIHTHEAGPSDAAIHMEGGTVSGLEPTVEAPVIIEENWVGCDHCEKWRLLPYGTKPEQLPEKWLCSMLDWLPGMNRCEISEDETTKAVHALYVVPVPENQHTFHTQAGGAMAGIVLASVNDFRQDNQKYSCDQMKKLKLKAKQNKMSVDDSVPSNSRRHFHCQVVKTGISKVAKESLTGANASNKSDMQHPNKSTIIAKTSNKRKGDFLMGEDGNPRKKLQKKSAQNVEGNIKQLKSKDVHNVDNLQTSGLKSGLPNEAAKKDGMKRNAQRKAISRGVGNIQICVKKQKDQVQDSSHDGLLGIKNSNNREDSVKKIKLKNFSDSQLLEEPHQNNGKSCQDRKVFMRENIKDLYFDRDKKSHISQTEEEFQRSEVVISSRKGAKPRVPSLESNGYQINGCIQKEHASKPGAKGLLTMDDKNKERKDLGCEELSMATTKNSSKVSDPHKNFNCMEEVKGSPEESVSSHPMRMPVPNQVSPKMMGTVGKVDSRYNGGVTVGNVEKFQGINEIFESHIVKKVTSDLTNGNGSEILDSRSNFKEEIDVDDVFHAPEYRVSRDKGHPFSDKSSMKSVRNSTDTGRRDLGKSSDGRSESQHAQKEHVRSGKKLNHTCSTDFMHENANKDCLRNSAVESSTKMKKWSGKLRMDLRSGDKQGASCPTKRTSGSLRSLKSFDDSRLLDTKLAVNAARQIKDTANACLQNPINDFIKNDTEGSVAVESSPGKHNFSGVTAFTALKGAEDILKEAEEHRIHADLIKNSGFSSESNHEYFKAGLKFLNGASLLEACNGKSNNHLQMNPTQMYAAAAKLCKICACEYEKRHEMAAATLAYKCMEVACLRIVYCISSTTCDVWQNLQSSLQIVPQGESPSSSASDVDNLNNLETTDKATLSKGSGSLEGNCVLLPCNYPDVVRLLDFAKDVDSAMEAAKKSQRAFSAVHFELKDSKEAITSIKRVMDYSFQNTEELVRLVWVAYNKINHQILSGIRE